MSEALARSWVELNCRYAAFGAFTVRRLLFDARE